VRRLLALLVAAAFALPLSLTSPAPTAAAAELAVAGDTLHPRLLFSSAEVQALRARVAAGGVPAQAWARLKEKADGHLLRVSPDVVRANIYLPVKELVRTPFNPNGTDLQGLQQPYTLQEEMPSYLIELGMAYQISGDPKYGRHAIELLKALGDAGWPFWTGGDDLGIGDLGAGVGLAFDWTYQLMTPAERSQIVKSLTADQDTLFVRTMFEYTNEASEYRTSNWQGVIGGGTGLLLLAIRGEPDAPTVFSSPAGPQIPNRAAGTLWPARTYTFQEYLDKALVKAGRYFTYGFDALGAGHEGHTYATYGLVHSVPFALAARREGLGDMLAGSGIVNTARWRAFEQLPGQGQNFVPLNDSARTSAGVDLESLMFAVAPDNGVAQWVWRRTIGDLGNDVYNDVHYPAPVGDDLCPLDRPVEAPLATAGCAPLLHTHGHVWAILFYRSPTETPEVDPATTGPLSLHYDALGLVDARTGFTKGSQETVSTFQARRNARTHHFQWDGGNFTLYGEGGRWAIDPGSACVACGKAYGAGPEEGHPTYHNVIVIDGSKLTQSENSRYFDGVTIDNHVNGPNVSLTHADMRYAYSADPNTRFDSPFAGRDHLFSRVPGRPVVVGIADELERDSVPFARTYQWQMITDRANTVAASGSGFTVQAPNGATLVGRSARDVSPSSTSAPTGDPTFNVEPISFNNNTDDSGLQYKISTVTAKQQRLEQVTVMAMTPAGTTPATTSVLRLNGANAVAVDWQGTREVFLRRVRSAAVVTGEIQTDARVAKLLKDQGETVMRDGRSLSAYGRDYVTVTGGRSRVVVSGNAVDAVGAEANSYRVFAPQAITTVSVNAVAVPSCREGDYLTFPCRQVTALALTSPTTAPATDVAHFSAVLTAAGAPVAGQVVTFTVGSLTASATTDAAGLAVADIRLDLDAASYPVSVTYAGDFNLAPSRAEATLTVVPDPTALTYTGQARGVGSTVPVSAVLTEDEAVPLAGQVVVFTSGTNTTTAVTDTSGRAAGVLTIVDHGRSAVVTATFAGGARYAPSTASGTVTWGNAPL